MNTNYSNSPALMLECSDCSIEFELTNGEKRFYEEKGLSLPKRCKPCREKRKLQRENQ